MTANDVDNRMYLLPSSSAITLASLIVIWMATKSILWPQIRHWSFLFPIQSYKGQMWYSSTVPIWNWIEQRAASCFSILKYFSFFMWVLQPHYYDRDRDFMLQIKCRLSERCLKYFIVRAQEKAQAKKTEEWDLDLVIKIMLQLFSYLFYYSSSNREARRMLVIDSWH